VADRGLLAGGHRPGPRSWPACARPVTGLNPYLCRAHPSLAPSLVSPTRNGEGTLTDALSRR
jgi:hypothetical protein